MSKAGSASKVKINSFDDLFGASQAPAGTEQVREIPLSELHEFKGHPFKVLDDEKMQETVESIRNYGVLMPGIARPRAGGGYEIIAGHRRKHGCELAGLSTMPMFVRDYSDDEATVAEHIYYEETEGNQGAALAVIDAQAEIDALPDPMIGLSEMEDYGYTWNEMLPLTKERALELFEHDLPIYVLHEDGSETTVEDRTQITEHEGIFGIEKKDWENERNFLTMQEELSENEAAKETRLLYGSTDKYGIYQLKDDPELRQFRFEGTEALKRMGITNR